MPRVFGAGGWPVVIEVSAVMPGPSEIVWDLLTDWEHLGDWMLEGSDFEVISAHRSGPGVRAAATIRIGGLRTRDEIEVSIWEPYRTLEIAHLGWVRGSGRLDLVPLGSDETRVDWREQLHNPQLGVLGSLGLTAFRPLMKRVFARDLRVLQGLVRARRAGPAGGRTMSSLGKSSKAVSSERKGPRHNTLR